MKRFFSEWILPPGLFKWIRSRVALGGSANVLTPPDYGSSLLDMRFDVDNSLLWLPVEKLRTPYGLAMTAQQHPFIAYLSGGVDRLEQFYLLHRPTTTFERNMIFLPQDRLPAKKEFRTPWALRPEIPSGTWGLGPEHGQQWFGPVSKEKLLLEVRRLENARKSLTRHGWNVKKAGLDEWCRFYLLVDDVETNDYRVVNYDATHRAAVLVHLGWPCIPARAYSHYPREIRLSDLEDWPGVTDGTYTHEQAAAYFMSYFRDPAKVLLEGW